MIKVMVTVMLIIGCTSHSRPPVESMEVDAGIIDWGDTGAIQSGESGNSPYINTETNLATEINDTTVTTELESGTSDTNTVTIVTDSGTSDSNLVIEGGGNEQPEPQDSGSTDTSTEPDQPDTGTTDAGVDSSSENDAGNNTDSSRDIAEPDPCQNGVQEGSETDVDCGGICTGCEVGQDCTESSDCQDDLVCFHGVCEVAKTCPIPTNGYPGLNSMTCIYYMDSEGSKIFGSGIYFLTREQMITATRCVASDPFVYAHTRCENPMYCPENYQDCIWNLKGSIGQCEHLGCNANLMWNSETNQQELQAVQWEGDPWVP